MGSEIKITIEEYGRPVFSGFLGRGLNWTLLECAFIVRAMTMVMEGSSDGLRVDVGLARCVGITKAVEEAAKNVDLTPKTFLKLMDREIRKRAAKKSG